MSQLLSVYRRLNREATALGLISTADYTGGGGAHIHTGIPYRGGKERATYVNHFVLWGAQNPWVAWAFLNVVDDINAEPITLDGLIGQSPGSELEGLRDEFEYATHAVNVYTKELHDARNREIRSISNCVKRVEFKQRYRMGLFKRIKLLERAKSAITVPLSRVYAPACKDLMLRETSYGKNGTIAFRCFEMGDEAKIKRQIIFANAVCDYVDKMTCTEFAVTTCYTQEQLDRMPWSKRRAGFLTMLDSLGLDRTEYRRELVQIALRMRYQRAEKRVSSGRYTIREYGCDRALARHQRRQTRNGRYRPAPASAGGCMAADVDEDFA